MSGVTKICKSCDKSFNTHSIKATRFEEYCPSCYQSKKRTIAEVNIVGKIDRAVMSIETRLDKLEASQDSIPMLVGAEVSSAMLDINSLTGVDIGELISNEIDNATTRFRDKQLKENKDFKDRLQAQIITLNNKIIKLIKEMD